MKRAIVPQEDVHVELSVRLTNGHFETKVSLPVQASDSAREEAIMAWFKFIEAALKAHRSAAEACHE